MTTQVEHPARAEVIPADGVRLVVADHGGSGQVALLLHGLAGYAGEWAATAHRLRRTHRVLVLDQRGHGESARMPGDAGGDLSASRAAYVADAVTVLERFADAPALLLGQSLGGHTAMLTAAERPDLVGNLVVAESGIRPSPSVPEEVGRWLRSWPVPFPSRERAEEFFAGQMTSEAARVWAGGLVEGPEGLRPPFDPAFLIDSLAEVAARDFGDHWRGIGCRTLLVRGERGDLPRDEARWMVEHHPTCHLTEIPGAGHDVHLDNPEDWLAAIENFLRT